MECTTVTETVPETKCTTEDVQECEIIQDEVCSPQYQTKCEPITTQSCRYVGCSYLSMVP